MSFIIFFFVIKYFNFKNRVWYFDFSIMFNFFIITFMPWRPLFLLPIISKTDPCPICRFFIHITILKLPFFILVKYFSLFPWNRILCNNYITILTSSNFKIFLFLIQTLNKYMGIRLLVGSVLYFNFYEGNTKAVEILCFIHIFEFRLYLWKIIKFFLLVVF